MLEVNSVSKSYHRVIKRTGVSGVIRDLISPQRVVINALHNVSLSINEGECVGLLGPNGAGKSTLIKIIASILEPDKGTVAINKMDPVSGTRRYKRQIGVVFGHRSRLVWDLPLNDVFELFRVLYDISKVNYDRIVPQLVEHFSLEELVNVPIRQLSLGQKMRCEIAAVLLPQPRLLLLDEPTLGLDTKARFALREMIKELRKVLKVGVLVASHDLFDIQELVNRVMVIDKGSSIYEGSPEDLVDIYGRGYEVSVVINKRVGAEPLNGFNVKVDTGNSLVATAKSSQEVSRLVSVLTRQFEVVNIKVSPPTLEEALMRLYGRGEDVV